MTKTEDPELKKEKCKTRSNPGASNAVYGIGLVGALVYYLQHADSLWVGVLGVLKAIVWPAFMVYKLLELLKM